MLRWGEHPARGVRPVDGAGREQAGLRRPAPGREYEFDHRADGWAGLRLHGVDMFGRDRPDGLRLAGLRLALPQAGTGKQPVPPVRRDHLFADGPAEHPFDPAALPVYLAPAPTGTDHLSLDRP